MIHYFGFVGGGTNESIRTLTKTKMSIPKRPPLPNIQTSTPPYPAIRSCWTMYTCNEAFYQGSEICVVGNSAEGLGADVYKEKIDFKRQYAYKCWINATHLEMQSPLYCLWGWWMKIDTMDNKIIIKLLMPFLTRMNHYIKQLVKFYRYIAKVINALISTSKFIQFCTCSCLCLLTNTSNATKKIQFYAWQN